jgi:hypothetical protein
MLWQVRVKVKVRVRVRVRVRIRVRVRVWVRVWVRVRVSTRRLTLTLTPTRCRPMRALRCAATAAGAWGCSQSVSHYHTPTTGAHVHMYTHSV